MLITTLRRYVETGVNPFVAVRERWAEYPYDYPGLLVDIGLGRLAEKGRVIADKEEEKNLKSLGEEFYPGRFAQFRELDKDCLIDALVEYFSWGLMLLYLEKYAPEVLGLEEEQFLEEFTNPTRVDRIIPILETPEVNSVIKNMVKASLALIEREVSVDLAQILLGMLENGYLVGTILLESRCGDRLAKDEG